MIYLDNNATTRIHPEVLEAMMPFLTGEYANPSSGYHFARAAKNAVAAAREQVAELLGAQPEEIIFTAGGTESDNTALASAAACVPERRHVVTSTVEHPAVTNYCEYLEQLHGYRYTRIPVDSLGQIDPEALDAAIDPSETALVSLMWANNETGVFFPVPDVARITTEKGVFFHTDAVQAIGKTPVKVTDTGIHFLSISGHKLHAPKGVGVLYVSSRARLEPRMLGGSQENNRRGGTENVAGIVGLGKAAELMVQKLAAAAEGKDPVKDLRDLFETELKSRLTGVFVNGHPDERLSNTANLAFDDIEAAGLLIVLDQKGICASGGSACHTGSLYVSPVLEAMGHSRERAAASVRFSLSLFSTRDEIDEAVGVISEAVNKLRGLRNPDSWVIPAQT